MKIYAVTLGFCPAKVLSLGLESLAKTKTISMQHYFMWGHYPLNQIENKKGTMDLCDQHQIFWRDSELDRGLTGNFNYWMELVKPEPDSFIMGLDPDMNPPKEKGWDQAMVDVLNADPKLAWCSLNIDAIRHNIHTGLLRGDTKMLAGQTCFYPERVDMFNITLWRTSFLLETKGLHANWNYYGGIEVQMVNRARSKGLNYCYLYDWEEQPSFGHLGDPEYMAYKNAHIHGFKGSFKEFLVYKESHPG